MKFTLIFPSHEAYDLSYGLVFIPCPVWVRGTEEIVNLNPENPHYQKGGVRRLIENERIEFSENEYNKRCFIIVHQTGNGEQKDLDTLHSDLVQEGFQVNVLYSDSLGIFCVEN